MLQVVFCIFLVYLGLFAGVMLREPRTLWSGAAFFLMLLHLGGFLAVVAVMHHSWLEGHPAALWALVLLAAAVGMFLLAFPMLLFFLFLVEGIRVLRHEGLRLSNFLSLGFAVLWFGFLFVWPAVGVWSLGSLGTAVYLVVSFSAVYMLSLMAMYALSALLNLAHLRKRRRLDYIVVLGAGVAGDRVPPLLAARIERGMALLPYNPQAKLILSGGQGPGEDLPEGEAMARYALARGVDPARVIREVRSATTEENLRFSRALMEGAAPRVAVVTTAYHVFRALILAKKQGLRCVGFGSKTKWYFTLNALLREFAGYISLTRRRHIKVLGVVAGLVGVVFFFSR